ncbi:uncharacterized protein PV09_07712 [Verruconis gallopava]|uniref:Phospholipid/glycerol acyltransferase domain-containing protein n=1 Tax=Verruconis gallopava TaxID=253628 RepID=A0A0D1YIN0_9PEZI|nr:uncharacterized protein PV09_07712 [Verruconis gallopava]KIW00727.1 hypothetical protein PV09_07712 [Verruconis gallopava]
MASIDAEGIRQRPQVLDEKSPVTSTTVKVQSEKEEVLAKHPGGSAHGPLLQAARIVALVVYFMGSCACMNATQLIFSPLYFYDKDLYYAWMAVTKQHFGLLAVTMQQWWSPTTVRVSGDKSVQRQLTQVSDGRLECDFPERMVLIANHELYTDWLYLWWIAYTADMHGHIYIILKESLKYVPILGWGMQFFSFIFLSRNWTKDRQRFAHRLGKLKLKHGPSQSYKPMWMLIFPEGTNLSRNSRAKSKAWAEKQGIPDMQHALLPRSTGLHFCLQELDDTVEWVYDCTLAYEGIPRGQYGQDIFTLRSIYLRGLAPKSVNMYWRRYAVASIPKDQAAFDAWLLARWREKDALLEYYMQHGRFPALEDDDEEKTVPNGAGMAKEGSKGGWIETELKPRSRFEFLQIFIPSMTIVLVLNLIRKFWLWLNVALSLRS